MTGTAVGSEETRPGGRGRQAERTDRPPAPARWQGARSALNGLAGRVADLLRQARSRWRSSLRVRVVSTTLVVSAVVVSMLGFFLMQQITANFLRKAESEAQTQASDGLTFAESWPSASQVPQASTPEPFMINLVNSLKSSGQNAADYGIAVAVSQVNSPVYVASVWDNLQYLPAKVVQQVTSRRPKHVLAFARMPYPDAGGSETTGLLYAANFGIDNAYQLYYFFPLTQVQIELDQVLRTLVLVGIALLFLLAGIAWLLTRWVVVPVARAAQGAQLLSTGNLGERLAVRGNDEVAALA
ncbi:MAG TPA: HAMP domain-containing protein, partial [Streptosporangiaceae bacterium]|nr:HAMP domain-containing protein [Streptosporangiaceae bacterium]